MKRLIGLVLALAVLVPVAFAQAPAAAPGQPPDAAPAAPVAPTVPDAPAASAAPAAPVWGPQPEFRGLLNWIQPKPEQWIAMTRTSIKWVGLMASQAAEMAALRLELLGLLTGENVDPKAVDEKADAWGQKLVKMTGELVDMVFEFREILTTDQRKAVLSQLCLRMLNRPIRQRSQLAGQLVRRIGERMPAVRQAAQELGLTVEQRIKLKRLALQHSPAVVRAGGEILSHAFAAFGELLADEPAKDKVKGSVEAASKKIVEILKIVTGAVREARAVLTPAQVEMVIARFPLRLLCGSAYGAKGY